MGCSSADHPQFIGDEGSGRPAGVGLGNAHDAGGAAGEADGEPKPTKPPGDLPTTAGGLNPESVYLLGSLQEGLTSDALARVESPDSYVLGFDYRAFGYSLGNDGLYYAFGGHVYRFTTDASLALPFEDVDYPAEPLANDVVVETPRCDAGNLSRFILGATGRLIYGCLDLGDSQYMTYYEGMDVVLEHEAGCVLDAVGANDLALCNTDHQVGVLNLTRPTETIAVEPITHYLLAYRAHDEGFWVVEATYPPTLWQVNADGSADKLGEYPSVPEGLFTGTGPTALSADGALYEISRHDEPGTGGDVIIRFTIEGAADIVYDENNDPNVKIHGSSLLTGN